MIHVLAEILPIIIKAAPSIATALSSPFSGLAMSLITKAVGASSGSAPDIIAKVMEDVPHATSVLQELENEHGDFMRHAMEAASCVTSIELNAKIMFRNSSV